jgi:hypothetical protein
MTGATAAVSCTAGIAAAAVAATGPNTTAFGEAFAIDPVTSTGRIVVLGSTLVVLALAAGPLHGNPREAEFYVLLQLAALGALVLTGAQDLLLLAAGYLLASVPAYALAGFRKDAEGTEAALKYYIVGALLGVVSSAASPCFSPPDGARCTPCSVANCRMHPSAWWPSARSRCWPGCCSKREAYRRTSGYPTPSRAAPRLSPPSSPPCPR